MDQMKLGDKQVQEAIAHFIREARTSAKPRYDEERRILGLAAMSTALACVAAVGEAFIKKRGTRAAVKEFYDLMVDKTSWLKTPLGTSHNHSQARKLLADIRDSLVHGLAVPPKVMLLPDQSADSELAPADRARWRIVVPDFIDAVDKTIAKLSEEKPGIEWNPCYQAKDRKPVEVRAWNTL